MSNGWSTLIKFSPSEKSKMFALKDSNKLCCAFLNPVPFKTLPDDLLYKTGRINPSFVINTHSVLSVC